MNRFFATILLIVIANTVNAADRRAPGFTWGEIRYPGSEQLLEQDDLVLEGAVHQGLELFRLSDRDRINLFGRIRYLVDTEELDFNNKLVFSTGVRFLHQLSDSAVIGAGVLYEFDRRFRSNRNLDGTTLFLDGFGSWRLQCDSCGEGGFWAERRFPGEMWAELRYPASHDPVEKDDLIFEGAIEQGVDWSRIGELGWFNTFAELEWSADSDGLDYYRSITGGLGIKLRFRVGAGGLIQIGGKYLLDRRWVSNQTEDGFMGFLNWSTSWDARTMRRDLPD